MGEAQFGNGEHSSIFPKSPLAQGHKQKYSINGIRNQNYYLKLHSEIERMETNQTSLTLILNLIRVYVQKAPESS